MLHLFIYRKTITSPMENI